MSDNPGYIHGYTDDEAERLIDQAEFLARWVFDGVDLDGVGTLFEVGMGVGAETRLLRARWPGLRVIGCDISDGQLAHARRILAPAFCRSKGAQRNECCCQEPVHSAHCHLWSAWRASVACGRHHRVTGWWGLRSCRCRTDDSASAGCRSGHERAVLVAGK